MKQSKLILAAIPLLMAACNGGDSAEETTQLLSSVEKLPGVNPTSFAARANAICDPLGGDETPDLEYGLRAKLDIMDPNASVMPTNLEQFDLLGAKRASQDLYFTDINVEPRPWDAGFIRQNGETVKDESGQTAFENFRLIFNSELELSENDAEGYYQFSLLSDDGSQMSIIPDGSGKLLAVDNDGGHPPLLGCANNFIHLQKGKRYPIELKYFQGSRYHVAMMLMWKYHGATQPSAGALADTGCGKGGWTQGTEYWFDTTQGLPSVAQPPFLNLVSRGWTTVKPINYRLPAGTPANMCAEIPEWPPEEGCTTDYYMRPTQDRFNLSLNPVDPARIEVIVDGNRPSYQFDANQNQIVIPGVSGVAKFVAIRSCKRVCTGAICDVIGI
jgi:hypothetical protein